MNGLTSLSLFPFRAFRRRPSHAHRSPSGTRRPHGTPGSWSGTTTSCSSSSLSLCDAAPCVRVPPRRHARTMVLGNHTTTQAQGPISATRSALIDRSPRRVMQMLQTLLLHSLRLRHRFTRLHLHPRPHRRVRLLILGRCRCRSSEVDSEAAKAEQQKHGFTTLTRRSCPCRAHGEVSVLSLVHAAWRPIGVSQNHAWYYCCWTGHR